jgi:hypothetical protein
MSFPHVASMAGNRMMIIIIIIIIIIMPGNRKFTVHV